MTTFSFRSWKEIRADPLNRELNRRYPLMPFFEVCVLAWAALQVWGFRL